MAAQQAGVGDTEPTFTEETRKFVPKIDADQLATGLWFRKVCLDYAVTKPGDPKELIISDENEKVIKQLDTAYTGFVRERGNFNKTHIFNIVMTVFKNWEALKKWLIAEKALVDFQTACEAIIDKNKGYVRSNLLLHTIPFGIEWCTGTTEGLEFLSEVRKDPFKAIGLKPTVKPGPSLRSLAQTPKVLKKVFRQPFCFIDQSVFRKEDGSFQRASESIYVMSLKHQSVQFFEHQIPYIARAITQRYSAEDVQDLQKVRAMPKDSELVAAVSQGRSIKVTRQFFNTLGDKLVEKGVPTTMPPYARSKNQSSSADEEADPDWEMDLGEIED